MSKEDSTVGKGCKAWFLLYLNEGVSGNLYGELIHLNDNKAIKFSDFTDAVLFMDRIMDELGSPQRLEEIRSFQQEGNAQSIEINHDIENPDRASDLTNRDKIRVIIRIYYRQHCSWQGELEWQQKRVLFRSVLELIYLVKKVRAGR